MNVAINSLHLRLSCRAATEYGLYFSNMSSPRPKVITQPSSVLVQQSWKPRNNRSFNALYLRYSVKFAIFACHEYNYLYGKVESHQRGA